MLKKKSVKEKNLIQLLNEAVASELQAVIQYMWQNIILVGKESVSIAPLLKKISIEEMKHAEMVAGRLNYLGGEPTTQPTPVKINHGLEEILKQDAHEEEKVIELYKLIIEKAASDKDYTTRVLFEKILSDEESHHDRFTKLLEK